jgi:predicted metalloendopeptidase
MSAAAPKPCPFLPVPSEVLTAACLQPFGKYNRGAEFYEMALKYAQSHWLQGMPAQALLQVNRALGSAVAATDEVLQRWPLPYAAVVWLLGNHTPEQFIGNPRRHYQHLATRMVEPRKALRTWRAWACWHLARQVLPQFSADEEQLRTEQIVEPTPEEIHRQLATLGHAGEADGWLKLADLAGSAYGGYFGAPPPNVAITAK